MASWRYEDISIGLRDDSWKKLSAQDVQAFLGYLSIPETRGSNVGTPSPVRNRLEPAGILRQMEMMPVNQAQPTEKLVFNEYDDLPDDAWKPLESSFQYLMLCSKERRYS